jgi:hypothetical protein
LIDNSEEFNETQEAVLSSEMSVKIYKTTWRKIPEVNRRLNYNFLKKKECRIKCSDLKRMQVALEAGNFFDMRSTVDF